MYTTYDALVSTTTALLVYNIYGMTAMTVNTTHDDDHTGADASQMLWVVCCCFGGRVVARENQPKIK
jgi:hypothetical protein